MLSFDGPLGLCGPGNPNTARVQRPAPEGEPRQGAPPPARLRPTLRPRFPRTFTNPRHHGRQPARADPPDQSPPGLAAAGIASGQDRASRRGTSWRFGQPGGHSEGHNTRSHPELGRENPQRRWYCRSSGGRAGRRQARQTPNPAPATRQPHQRSQPQPIPAHTAPPRGGAAR